MATKNVVDLPTAATLVGSDKVVVVDISDTTEGPLGTVKIAAGTTLATLFNTLTTAGLTAVVNNGVVYVNSGGAVTSSSGFKFDGVNAGIAVAPISWGSNYRALQVGYSASLWSGSTGELAGIMSNVYFDNASYRYINNGAATRYTQSAGEHSWGRAVSGTAGGVATFVDQKNIDSSGNWLPGADNTQNIGSGALRMAVIYAGTGTINTSDAREKTDVAPMALAEKAAAQDLAAEMGTFQFLASVAEKGDAARHHVGMTVQRAIEIMESHGLNPFKYGFICYDSWDTETKEVVAEDGAYSRVVERQAYTEKQVDYIEVVDGVPVQKSRIEKEPKYTNAPVVDAAGNEIPGLTHPVPVMETVTERYNIETVREAGDRYSFRTDQLALFILAGIA